ncbi:MAG: hypothetical protein RJB60_837 [Pseudomonadota bacterium]|jgi:hypothetical protein
MLTGIRQSEESSAGSQIGAALPASPLVSRERWAEMLGLPSGVVIAQCERGMWGAPIRIGKRVFVNVEAIRLQCAERAQEFAL